MIVSEAEAKRKWCPLVIASHTDPRGRVPEGTDAVENWRHPCIGSACMGWRWAIAPDQAKRQGGKEPQGYCGHAGKP